MQRSEIQWRPRLDAGQPDHPYVRGRPNGGLQQRTAAGSGLLAQHVRTSGAVAGRGRPSAIACTAAGQAVAVGPACYRTELVSVCRQTVVLVWKLAMV
jgi:hypothetical protein